MIGSGVAGLRAAISLAEAGDVVLLTKADPRESNTGYAQGGIAAALGADDSPDLHARDTTAAGDGLCVSAAVDVPVHEGPRYVQELLDWGAAFDRDADGRPCRRPRRGLEQFAARRAGVRRPSGCCDATALNACGPRGRRRARTSTARRWERCTSVGILDPRFDVASRGAAAHARRPPTRVYRSRASGRFGHDRGSRPPLRP